MKTYNVVKFGKGGYVDTRIGGRAENRQYCKNQTELKNRIKELKADGYVESK